MKRLTIISYSFPPTNAPAAQRPYTIAKYLGKEGYKVNVLTCSNQDSSLGVDDEMIDNTGFNLFKVPGISLTWFRKRKAKQMVSVNNSTDMKGERRKSILSKWIFPDKAISWFPSALVWCLFHPHKFIKSNILTTSPLATNHLLGLFVKFLYRPFWVADIRDFHYIKNYEKMNDNLNVRLQKWLEKKIITKADVVTFISQSMLNEYAKYYKEQAGKMRVIYNGYDPEDFESLPDLSKVDLDQKPIRIFYAGTFYKGVRSPIPLLAALDSLVYAGTISLNDISISIAGNFEKTLLNDIVEFKSSKRIMFLGNLPRREVLTFMKNAHLLWLIVGDETTHSAGIPVKAFEYIGAKRPILCFAPKNTETPIMIENLNAGWILSNKIIDINLNVEILKRIFSENLYVSSINKENNTLHNVFNRRCQAIEFGNLVN